MTLKHFYGSVCVSFRERNCSSLVTFKDTITNIITTVHIIIQTALYISAFLFSLRVEKYIYILKPGQTSISENFQSSRIKIKICML